MNKHIRISLGIFMSMLMLIPVSEIYSQSVIEEITVTARQREESLREVPATITVLTEQQIQRSGVQRATDFIALIASLISFIVLAPVGKKIGVFFFAMYFRNSK